MLSLPAMDSVSIPFKLLNTQSYSRFYSIKFTHRWNVKLMDALSYIVNVIEIISQRQKFNGCTIVTFSLKNNNGRTVFLSCIYWQPLWLSMSEIYEWDYQMNPEWLFFLCNILMKHKLQYLVVLIKGKGLGLKPKDWVSVIVSRLPRDLNP